MAEMTVIPNSILPRQEAFLVDPPTPAPHPFGGFRLSALHTPDSPTPTHTIASTPARIAQQSPRDDLTESIPLPILQPW